MYNGIGLFTPRGSGTSGYVQKSLAFVKPKQVIHNYKEVLEKFKENPAPIKKKANSEIIEHEVKHKIEVELFNYLDDLKSKGLEDSQVDNLVNKRREELYKEFERNKSKGVDLESMGQNSHHQSKLKDIQMEKMKNALGIKQDYEAGTAFDIELQEEIRKKKMLEKKEERRKMKKEIKKSLKEEEKIKKAQQIEREKEQEKRKNKLKSKSRSRSRSRPRSRRRDKKDNKSKLPKHDNKEEGEITEKHSKEDRKKDSRRRRKSSSPSSRSRSRSSRSSSSSDSSSSFQ